MDLSVPQRYRLMIFQRPTGPWHPSQEAAEAYAVKRKMASRSEWGGVWITVPAWIKSEAAPAAWLKRYGQAA